MPEGAVYVGRPTKWGNPWKVVPTGREPGLFGGKVTVYTVEGPGQFFAGTDENQSRAADYAVSLYRAWLARLGPIVDELRGYDLACWCPLEDELGAPWPCHADVLLELANE